jgi:hypothetical protein
MRAECKGDVEECSMGEIHEGGSGMTGERECVSIVGLSM